MNSILHRPALGLAKRNDEWPAVVHAMFPVLRWISPDGRKIAYVVARTDGTFRVLTEELVDCDGDLYWYTRFSESSVTGSLDSAVCGLFEDEPWTRAVEAEMKDAGSSKRF